MNTWHSREDSGGTKVLRMGDLALNAETPSVVWNVVTFQETVPRWPPKK
jgi:hypothetical protein